MLADAECQRPRVHPGDAGHPARREPGAQILARPPARGPADVLAYNQAARGDMGGLDILVIDADIADMRKSEGDDLAGIGGIGEGFLIAGHAGIEADLADRRLIASMGAGMGAEAAPPEHRAVGEDQRGGGAFGGMAGVGHGVTPRRKVASRGEGEVGEVEAGRGDEGRPVAGGDAARLAPFAQCLGADAEPLGGRVGPAEAGDEIFDGDGHRGVMWEIFSQNNEKCGIEKKIPERRWGVPG